MDFFDRGIQLYLLSVAVIATVVGVWGTNRFILENTTAGTGWTMMIGIALVLVAIGLVTRYLRSSPDQSPDEYPW